MIVPILLTFPNRTWSLPLLVLCERCFEWDVLDVRMDHVLVSCVGERLHEGLVLATAVLLGCVPTDLPPLEGLEAKHTPTPG